MSMYTNNKNVFIENIYFIIKYQISLNTANKNKT